MSRRAVQVFALALTLLMSSAASLHAWSPIGPPSTPRRIEKRPVPGPIEPGFQGQAFAVPTQPVAGPDVNAVPVTLQNDNGEVVGTDVVRAGQPRLVEALDGESEEVAIPWGDGITAYGQREDFWAMPSFVELRDMTVTIDGKTTSLGRSGLVYHRGSASLFDDPQTPAHDGISLRSRQFLNCEEDSWSIGQQTFTVDLVELGVHRRDRSLIDKGVIGLDWGAALPIDDAGVHQLYRGCDDTTVPDHGKTHHTTQWLESMGRAVYLLAASEYAGEFRSKIDSYIDRIELVAGRLAEPDNWEEWVGNVEDENGDDFTHRTFMMAAGLGLASTLTDDAEDASKWEDTAATIARRGIGNQTGSGVNPERGGYDVQYQMYGVWLAEIYHSTLAPTAGVKPELEMSINRAVEWMIGHVDQRTGQIIIGESTRICNETNWWSGTTAAFHDPAETIRAFLLWGHVSSNGDLVDQAILLDRGQKRVGNDCPVRDAGSSASPGRAPVPKTPGGDRSFETPIGNLSNRRVMAAAAVALVCFLLLRRLPAARGSAIAKQAVRVGGPVMVFVAAAAALAG